MFRRISFLLCFYVREKAHNHVATAAVTFFFFFDNQSISSKRFPSLFAAFLYAPVPEFVEITKTVKREGGRGRLF